MADWEPILLEPRAPDTPLAQRVVDLLKQQRSSWDLLRTGESALANMTIKRLTVDNADVVVQANPGRSTSTNARVDKASIEARPCFLCPGNLPPDERGVAWRDFVLLPNPFPILSSHLTIALRTHEPQRLVERAGDLLALAGELGPDLFVFYNGPRCGASAPDHMHFQACAAAGVPLLEQAVDLWTGDRFAPATRGGRRLLCAAFESVDRARERLVHAVASLQEIAADSEEPMMNVVCLCRGKRYEVYLFPRGKHRSACYFAEPESRIAVSPAAIEMAGVVVVADPAHFDRVDESVVGEIFSEVTLERERFERLAQAVA